MVEHLLSLALASRDCSMSLPGYQSMPSQNIRFRILQYTSWIFFKIWDCVLSIILSKCFRCLDAEVPTWYMGWLVMFWPSDKLARGLVLTLLNKCGEKRTAFADPLQDFLCLKMRIVLWIHLSNQFFTEPFIQVWRTVSNHFLFHIHSGQAQPWRWGLVFEANLGWAVGSSWISSQTCFSTAPFFWLVSRKYQQTKEALFLSARLHDLPSLSSRSNTERHPLKVLLYNRLPRKTPTEMNHDRLPSVFQSFFVIHFSAVLAPVPGSAQGWKTLKSQTLWGS